VADQLAVLVVGVDSMIGGALASAWSERGAHVIGTTRRAVAAGPWIHLDVSSPAEPRFRFSRTPELAYLCAAVTNMERCEEDPAGTSRVNVQGTVGLARRLSCEGAWILFPSSNIVFDGNSPGRMAQDAVSPPAEYGRQKARAEAEILSLGNSAVIRMGKVVGRSTGPFAGWAQSLRQGVSIEAFTDKVCAPLSLGRTAQLMVTMGERRLAGTFQACARRDITYEEAARFLARRLGASEALVRPVLGRDRGIRSSFLPAHTTLDASALVASVDWTPPDPEAELLAGLGL